MAVPILVGTGIMPAAGPVVDEITSTTRRAFIPKLVVQIYQSTPLIQALIDNAQFATGGADPISLPVQGAPMVTGSWSGFGGQFNLPGAQPGITLAQATLKLLVVPIPFVGMEGLIQMDHAVIPLIEARLNDATTTVKQMLASAVYNNTAAINAQAMTGLIDAIDDGTNTDLYMGISRAANPWWKAIYVNAGGANPTRNLILQYIAQLVKKCGEHPKMGVTGFGTWTQLATDFLPLERYNHSAEGGPYRDIHSAFHALDVAGVPVYPDPFAPEGIIRFFNTEYLALYLHEAAAFDFSGFQSTIPNGQIGFVGVLATAMELVNTKPATSSSITNLGFLPI